MELRFNWAELRFSRFKAGLIEQALSMNYTAELRFLLLRFAFLSDRKPAAGLGVSFDQDLTISL